MSKDDLSGFVPDRVPDWLVQEIRKRKGTDLSGFTNLDSFYKETEAVHMDRFDRKMFREMRKKAEDLQELATKRYGTDPSWMELIQDEFLALFKADPELRKKDEMKPTHQINHAVMNKATQQRDWQELRTYTKLDDWVSAMAAVNFGRRIEEMFEEQQELQEAQDQMNQANEDVENLVQQLEMAADNGDEDAMDDLVDQLENALEAFGDAADGVSDQIKQNQNNIRQAAKQASNDAKKDTQEAQDAIESFGTDPGALSRMPHSARMELAARIYRNKKLRDMADKIGRFVRMALGEQARKITHAPEEVYDVELGDDLNRLLPQELVKLVNEVTEDLFYKDWQERNLMQYKLRGSEKVAKGGIICMIDSSGSMGGVKEIWSKAVAIALLNIAAKQGRDFTGILFSSASDPLYKWEFPKGMAGPLEVLEFAESFIGGGTDFMKPLAEGVDILRRQYDDDNAQKGDIMFITDGISAITDEFFDRFMNNKEELGFRVYTCVIGTSPGPMTGLSDHIYRISDFASPGDVREAFGYM